MTPARATPHPALSSLLPKAVQAQHKAVRVTTQAKMIHLISFALASFRDDPTIPLVLHCFPPAPASSSPSAGSSTSTQPLSNAPPPVPASTAPVQQPRTRSIDALPKLVSVVEVIKREYSTFVASVTAHDGPATSTTAEKGKGKEMEVDVEASESNEPKIRREGLHQYTLLTTFENVGIDEKQGATDDKDPQEGEQERQERIVEMWLGSIAGKNKRPRMKHTPCMVVVLSTRPVAGLVQLDYSHQQPQPLPKLPRAAKRAAEPPTADATTAGEVEPTGKSEKPKKRQRRRRRKRSGKENEAVGADGAGDMSVDEPVSAA
ncbi:hypothetical protein JCM10212_004773 [Sporobolomyces blumeae]